MTNSLQRRLAVALLAVPLLAGSAMAYAQTQTQPNAATAPAATPINQLRDMSAITLNGRVAEVYGNSFVLEDATGRALVDTGPRGDRGGLVAAGDTVSVEGRFDRGKLMAESLTGADGERTRLERPRPERDGPPGSRGPGGPGGHGPRPGPDGERAERRGGPMEWLTGGGIDADAAQTALAGAGYADVTLVDTKKHHAEFTAKDASGAMWRVKVDEDNRIAERQPYVAPLGEDAARASATQLGYTDVSNYELRGDHVEFDARDKSGRDVRIKLNADGSLRKERFES